MTVVVRGMIMDCKVCAAVSGDLWRMRLGGAARGGGGGVGDTAQIGGGFSPGSEHDLAMMVCEFMEYGSGGADSRCSSDNDSGLCDISDLAQEISYLKLATEQCERDMLSVVNSLLLSIDEMDVQHFKSGLCNASCIRFFLVKLLRLSGYDAGVCTAKWPGSGRVPGGDHEYIDVINYNNSGSSERLIIDVDFHSHFEIARAVESYDRMLSSLPVVYVGSWSKLKQYLQVMAEAARSSLKQNSMPFPPWRSLAYLQAKWESPYQRKFSPDEPSFVGNSFLEQHTQCGGFLRRLQSEIELELQWRAKLDRRKQPGYKTPSY